MEKNKLTKSKDAKLLGVCGGIAEWLGVDPTVVRIATVVVSLFSGIGIVAYIIGALLMPKEE
jgi:phage shock protein PspC (stress-responsive transcriptional regulator)